MKKDIINKMQSYTVLSIGGIMIGIMLIPIGILFLLVFAIWNGMNRLLCLLETGKDDDW